jgi:hypothetical protein
MFRITGKTCHAFSLAEILIMAAMNDAESIRLAPCAALPERRGEYSLLSIAPVPQTGAALSS